MNYVYLDNLKGYLEDITELDKDILFLQDDNGLMDGIEDIDLFLYPHKVIQVSENVVFRANYEDIKHNKDEKYILVLKNSSIKDKLLDFIKRSEKGKIIKIDFKSLLNSIEDNVNWHEDINEFSGYEIKERIKELLYYRKQLKKTNIEKNEVYKIVLSVFLDLDATKIKDDVDCYLYYKKLKEIYPNLQDSNWKLDVAALIYKVFSENGYLLANIIKEDLFNEFEELVWVCAALQNLKILSEENIEKVLGKDFYKLTYLKENTNEIIEFTRAIEKKDKLLYIQRKESAEKLVYNAGINVYEKNENYKTIIREGNGTYISVIESIKTLLEGFNLEGIKKVFRYGFNDLLELKKLIENNSSYKTENITKAKKLFDLIINFVEALEYAEKQLAYLKSNYLELENLYVNHLCDLQYNLSKIKYCDNDNLIESIRYENIENRINKVLNRYRKKFAEIVEINYDTWRNTEYGASRPILNSDICKLINIKDNKTFIIIFDGMRYDAWKHIVKPYFEKTLSLRNSEYKISYALLPSITSISREAIYNEIIKNYKEDVNYITKSESVKNEKLIKDSILQDKKINVFIFNMFDRDGHKATEDFYIFYDKQRKVFEKSISELIKVIPNDSNIVIASDHGLMRIDENINIKDENYVTAVKSRYLKVNNSIKKDGFINIEDNMLSYDNKGYFIGGGEKDYYSHGGVSIEEIMLPLIISETKTFINSKELFNKKMDTDTNEIEIYQLDDNISLNLSFKLNDKEKIILNSLYSFKNQNISSRDIEKILKNKTGKVGMTGIIIRKLIRKLKEDDYNIIEESAAGELIIYKFNERGLKEAKL